MFTTRTGTQRVDLIRSSLQENGVHSSAHLIGRISRGEMVRVRRGVYLPAQAWAEAPPWARYRIAICAAAMTQDLIFCRDSALVLHGIPLLSTPPAIFARTANPGEAKTHAPPQMTGRVPLQQFLRRYSESHPEAAPLRTAHLSNFPTKRLEPARPKNISRPEHRAQLRSGTFSIPEVRLTSGALEAVAGPAQGYRAEPLGLAALDAASRMSFTEAVVVLDAVKARDDAAPEPWLPYLGTKRQQAHWRRAWGFADAGAESALESESRVVLAQISCPAPTLQKVVRTSIGDFRMDFCWERERVAGEVDGRAKYFEPQYTNGADPAEVHYREKRRREALEAEGWQLVRWGKAELRNRQELVKRLGRAGLRPIST